MFAHAVNYESNILCLWGSSGESVDNASICKENAENEGNKSLNAVLMSGSGKAADNTMLKWCQVPRILLLL